jgi:multicomponent K+:H+ antiporter subunit A
VGIIDHETGTRDMRRLDGLFRFMPFTGTLAMVACAAMAGVPLLNGFLSKEMFFAEALLITGHPWLEYGLPAIATVYGVFGVVYSLRFGHDVFFGPPPQGLPHAPQEPRRWMRVPIDLLVLACVAVGVAPAFVIGPTLAAAARPVVGGTLPTYNLAVWHGFTAPFAMSLVAIVGGLVVYVWAAEWFKRQRGAPLLGRVDGQRLFENGLARLNLAARKLLRLASTHRLQAQMLDLLLVAGAAGLGSALIVPLEWGDRARVPASIEFILLWTVGAACAVGAAYLAKFHRLQALILLGAVGLMVCLTFAWFSAPDLALTQLAVETVTTVLFLLGLRWLPRRVAQDEPRNALRAAWRRRRDVALAVLAGAGLAALSYAMLTRTAPQSISPFFLRNALPVGGGTNVVNVMLVDFRAFDTLGEITVLAAVALTVYALLRRFRPPRETIGPPPQQRIRPPGIEPEPGPPGPRGDDERSQLLVPAVLVRLLLPVACVFALHLFLRGHNEPGGGFVAGLVVAIALITQYMVGGTHWVEARTDLRPARWIGAGLLLALVTGLGSLAFGYPFLTTHTAHFTLPVIGELHLPSAFFFDLGVFAVVLGATLLLLMAIAHQSLRAQRRSGAAVAQDGER